MRLRKVKPSMIKVPAVRVTAKFDEETRQLLRDSIKEVGIIAPILCQEINGELVLVDGLHRLEDSLALGDSPIDVAILDGDMADLLCRNLFLDHARGKTPVSEMVKVIKELYAVHGFDPDKIKAKTGLPRDYIEKLIKVAQLDPVTFAVYESGRIGLGMALELARLPYPLQREEILAKLSVLAEPKVADYKTFVDKVLEYTEVQKSAPVPTGTAPRSPPVYHCEGCKDEVEPRYLRPVMVCPNCFGEIWRLAKARATPEVKVE